MKRFSFFCMLLVLGAACNPKQQADLLISNATIYTVNADFDIAEAVAVKDGKIIAVGTTKTLSTTIDAERKWDAKGAFIYPGFIDAHAHLYNLGLARQQVDLVGTQSVQEILDRVMSFQNEKQLPYILGRGWDQNDWKDNQFPNKDVLDVLFPNTPVALTRIDGHAMWVNTAALKLAGITAQTKMPGGEVVLENGTPSGILIDTPMSLIRASIPKPSIAYNTQALKEAANFCVANGLTTVSDAGLSREIIYLIDSLQQANEIELRLYAMVSNTPADLNHFLQKGIIKTNRLHVRSVKVYGDGALGSRGAALRAPYHDKPNHFGAMITPIDSLAKLAPRILKAGYQMNTHAIGDSANISVLRVYSEVLKNETDARWRVEHAQVVSPQDFKYFSKNIIPSIQPTHATSDMYWAENRIGPKRIQGAYAYKTLLEKAGMVALGTDFPVERVNPLLTFYAAVGRVDLNNYPEGGFRMEDALSREAALKGMTIWAAFSNFEDQEKGSIELGKLADFTVLDKDIMQVDISEVPNTKVLRTYIDGNAVFTSEKN